MFKVIREITMINRYRIAVTGACLLVAAAQRLPAQGNPAEIFGGFTYAHANPETPLPRTTLGGWGVGATGYANSWFGAGFEIAGQFGSLSAPSSSGVTGTALNVKEYSYLVGPQFRFLDTAKVQSSFRWLIGGVFGQANLPSTESAANVQALSAVGYNTSNETKLAMMFAVPVDVSLCRLLALRIEPSLYMTDFAPSVGGGSVAANQHQWNFRFMIGPVFRLGKGK
jgi:hypothetical protein